MKKIFCDACEDEILNNRDCHKFNYLCHIDDLAKSNMPKYVDSSGDYISGRELSKDLCNKCYNKVFTKALKEFYKLKGEKNEC